MTRTSRARSRSRHVSRTEPVDPGSYQAELEASLEILKGLVARTNLRAADEARTDRVRLDDKAAILRAQLDLVAAQLEASPDLRAEFERHSLMQNYFPFVDETVDLVAQEIAQNVRVKWADRKKAPHAGEPWTRRADVWIRHVFKRWYDSGRLLHKHLRYDADLSNAYNTMLFRHPERDLGLAREAEVRRASGQTEKAARVRKAKNTLRKRFDRATARQPRP